MCVYSLTCIASLPEERINPSRTARIAKAKLKAEHYKHTHNEMKAKESTCGDTESQFNYQSAWTVMSRFNEWRPRLVS